ncbi:hypothetical protein H7I76_03815, partial [Mycolicibacterium vaccae]|nr:hypothetical protein [Mycolicibacterium vaccae]
MPRPDSRVGSLALPNANSGLIVAISLGAMLLRGFTFGIDFEGGTKVSFPRSDAQATTSQ